MSLANLKRRVEQLELDICASKHGGNRESREAHVQIEPTKQETRDRILQLARQRGAQGITADEVAIEWAVTHNHVAPRISELKKLGLLVATNRRRATSSGCSARVLVAGEAR